MINLQLTERELDLIIDATVTRQADLVDVLLFSVNPLAVKLRIKELSKFIDELRNVKGKNNEQI